MLYDEIQKTLKSMIQKRTTEATWLDDGDNKQTGLLKYAEALETFLIPINLLMNQGIQHDLKSTLAGSIDSLKQDVDFLIKKVDTDGWSGDPYLTELPEYKEYFGASYVKKNETDFVDSASFIITSFIDYLTYLNSTKEDKRNKEQVENCKNIIYKSLNFILDKSVKDSLNGEDVYFWTNNKKDSSTPSSYFTYTAIVAIGSVMDNREILDGKKINVDLLKKVLNGCANWAKDIIIIKEMERYVDANRIPAHSEEFDPKIQLVYIILIFEACYEHWSNKIESLELDIIIKNILFIYNLRSEDFLQENAHIVWFSKGKEFPTRKMRYVDKTAEFLLIDGLCWAFSILRKTNIDVNPLRAQIDSLIKRVLNERHPEKYTWRKDQYEIYYNQRAIESLCYYITYVDQELPSPETIQITLKEKDLINAAIEEAINISFKYQHKNIRENFWKIIENRKKNKLR